MWGTRQNKMLHFPLSSLLIYLTTNVGININKSLKLGFKLVFNNISSSLSVVKWDPRLVIQILHKTSFCFKVTNVFHLAIFLLKNHFVYFTTSKRFSFRLYLFLSVMRILRYSWTDFDGSFCVDISVLIILLHRVAAVAVWYKPIGTRCRSFHNKLWIALILLSMYTRITYGSTCYLLPPEPYIRVDIITNNILSKFHIHNKYGPKLCLPKEKNIVEKEKVTSYRYQCNFYHPISTF